MIRRGQRILPRDLISVEQTVVGVLGTRGADEKIRRWALNALAQFGHRQYSLEPVKDALVRYRDDPQTAASAIAAIYKLAPEPDKLLAGMDTFDPLMEKLAALQHVSPSKLNLKNVIVDVEKSDPEHLKLGLVVVGLDRAPPNLFHPRHSNSEIVRALGGHHNNIVSQYSVWAITENPNLGLSDLGVNIKDVESQPANVRSWIYKLIVISSGNIEKHIDFIELGSRDLETEARLGLAEGLRDTFFDGIEPLVLDWFGAEDDLEIQHHLLDHMVRQCEKCLTYERFAKEIYESEKPNSAIRKRMEANSSGTKLYREFKSIALDDNADLFKGKRMVKNVNFYGDIQTGAFSLEGDATANAPVSNEFNSQTIQTLQSEFSKALIEIRKLKIDDGLKQSVVGAVEAAQSNPEPSLVSQAIQGLKKIEETAQSVVGTSTVLGTIIAALQAAIGS